MSKIKDWLKVVKAGIQNGDKIVEAIWISTQMKNEGVVSAEAVAEIMKRKEICAECPFNSANAPAHGIKPLDVPFQHCVFCACRIGGEDTKEYCLSCNCGITEWNRDNPDKKMELKWSAFTQPINTDEKTTDQPAANSVNDSLQPTEAKES